jgi:hypothetical protein
MKLLSTLMLLGSFFTCNLAYAQTNGQVLAAPMAGKCTNQIQIADQRVSCSDTPILIGKLFKNGVTVFKLHYAGEESPVLGLIVINDEVEGSSIVFSIKKVGFGDNTHPTLKDITIGKCLMTANKEETEISSIVCAAKDVDGKSYGFNFEVTHTGIDKNSTPVAPAPKAPFHLPESKSGGNV